MGDHAAEAGNRIADELQRLCCAETEGEFFDFVTESVNTICHLLRERDEWRSKWIAMAQAGMIAGIFTPPNDRS